MQQYSPASASGHGPMSPGQPWASFGYPPAVPNYMFTQSPMPSQAAAAAASSHYFNLLNSMNMTAYMHAQALAGQPSMPPLAGPMPPMVEHSAPPCYPSSPSKKPPTPLSPSLPLSSQSAFQAADKPRAIRPGQSHSVSGTLSTSAATATAVSSSSTGILALARACDVVARPAKPETESTKADDEEIEVRTGGRAPACNNCRRSKVKCEGSIPCSRCIRLCWQSSCVREYPRKRGRKRKSPTMFGSGRPVDPYALHVAAGPYGMLPNPYTFTTLSTLPGTPTAMPPMPNLPYVPFVQPPPTFAATAAPSQEQRVSPSDLVSKTPSKVLKLEEKGVIMESVKDALSLPPNTSPADLGLDSLRQKLAQLNDSIHSNKVELERLEKQCVARRNTIDQFTLESHQLQLQIASLAALHEKPAISTSCSSGSSTSSSRDSSTNLNSPLSSQHSPIVSSSAIKVPIDLPPTTVATSNSGAESVTSSSENTSSAAVAPA